MDALLPERRGRWEEGWEEEEKAKIASDKKEEYAMKGRRANKGKRWEPEPGGKNKGGMQR